MKKNILLYFLIGISIGYLIYSYIFLGGTTGMMMYHHYGYYSDYWTTDVLIYRALSTLAYIILIIGTAILFLRKSKHNDKSLEILDNRLSSGTLSLEEYREIKKELQK